MKYAFPSVNVKTKLKAKLNFADFKNNVVKEK